MFFSFAVFFWDSRRWFIFKTKWNGTQPIQRRIDTSCHTLQQYVMFYFTNFYGLWDFSVLPIFRYVCPMLSLIMNRFKFYDFSHNSLVGTFYLRFLFFTWTLLVLCSLEQLSRRFLLVYSYFYLYHEFISSQINAPRLVWLPTRY